MKPHVSLALLTMLSTTLLLPLPAQDAAAPPAQPVTISLSFGGGTLADFIDQIREKEPKANIIVAEATKAIRLPAIELRGAGLESVLAAACAVVEGPRVIRVQDYRGAGEPVFSVLLEQQGLQESEEAQQRARRMTQVHSLNHLTDGHGAGVGFTPAVILSSLETAMEGTGEAPSLKFHKESGLLILRGNAEQQEIAGTVVQALHQEVERRANERANREASGATGSPNEKATK